MITAAVITNATVVATIYGAGLASSLIVGCHWFRGAASKLERGRRA